MSTKENKESLVLGAALFAMFFGAGNLIFPPFLGLIAGKEWHWSILGFFITGIGLPLLGVIASAKAGGDIDKLGRRVSPLFSKFLGITVVLAIGPLLAIPRTGATAYEMSALQIMPSVSPIVFAVIYFGISLFLAIKPNDVMNRIGKILTPGLLVLLGILIFKGIFDPIGAPLSTEIAKPFTDGFTTGYQTMDAMAAMLFGSMVTLSLSQSGYTDVKDQLRMTTKAGIIAVIGLTLVYGGLGYLGATGGVLFGDGITRTNLIIKISNSILGNFGKYGLGLVVSLACLTTSVGLTATVGQYFSSITKGKLKYEWVVIATTLFSGIMSIRGVESIVKFAEPILVFMYPIVIVIILLTVFSRGKPNKSIYKYSVSATILVSVLKMCNMFDIGDYLPQMIKYFPFSSWELGWIIPAILGIVIGLLIPGQEDERVA